MDEPHRSHLSAGRPRVLVVTPRIGLRFAEAIAGSDDVDLVGVAPTTDEAAALVLDLEPDLALVDLDHKALRADASLGRIRTAGSGVRLVGMTREPGGEWVGDAVRAGVSAVVKKSEDTTMLADVLRLVAEVGAISSESARTG